SFSEVAYFSFTGNAGDAITITAQSDGDSYLSLLDSNNNLLTENDDVTPNDLSSRIDYTLPSGGQYFIGVTTYRAASFTVTLTGSSANSGQSTTSNGEQTTTSPNSNALAYGDTVNGENVSFSQ